jgi:hypothetical protein
MVTPNSKQQDLIESAERNLAERIKVIKEDGDGYMTIVTTEELPSFLDKLKQDREKYKAKLEAERRK